MFDIFLTWTLEPVRMQRLCLSPFETSMSSKTKNNCKLRSGHLGVTGVVQEPIKWRWHVEFKMEQTNDSIVVPCVQMSTALMIESMNQIINKAKLVNAP